MKSSWTKWIRTNLRIRENSIHKLKSTKLILWIPPTKEWRRVILIFFLKVSIYFDRLNHFLHSNLNWLDYRWNEIAFTDKDRISRRHLLTIDAGAVGVVCYCSRWQITRLHRFSHTFTGRRIELEINFIFLTLSIYLKFWQDKLHLMIPSNAMLTWREILVLILMQLYWMKSW